MKTIPFNAENSSAVTAACREIEGRAKARLFWWQWGEAGLQEVELALEHLPKAHRAGVAAVLDSGDRLPNSYGHSADATYVQILWRGGRWVLGEVRRDYAKSTSFGRGTGRHVVSISVSQAQAEILAEHHRRASRIQIKPPEKIELADYPANPLNSCRATAAV